MLKLVPLVLLVLVSSSVPGAEPQFKNERAKKASEAYQLIEEEAQKAFETKMKAAREAYIKELEIAVKEAGGAGDLDEANRLAELKEDLERQGDVAEQDRLAHIRKDLIGSTWKPSNRPQAFHRFLSDNKTVNHQGTKGVWVVTDKTTALAQSYGSSNIYVFEFDKDLKKATVFRFEKSKDKPDAFRRR